ncbi:MAG TPA: hypothetical protein VFV06_00155 [Sphingorhabdus sp.]|nr:hypothetical protein [Sphingorhabdus sp.]
MFLSTATVAADWRAIEPSHLHLLQDDDIERQRAIAGAFEGVSIAEMHFSENGFDWHLLRFANVAKPDGPLWVVPHDDENAAFDAMLTGLKHHGGVAIVVNTGSTSSRRQAGNGLCGVRISATTACDPNRNFDARTPMFTNAILGEWEAGRPVIALHTNSDGFAGDGAGGRGDITMLDSRAYQRGVKQVRTDGFLGIASAPPLNDPDAYAIIPYDANRGISDGEAACRGKLNEKGIHVWHERVGKSDGSLSNYIALNRPEIAYVNFEAERAADLSIGAEAQRIMIDAYLESCPALWNQPIAIPAQVR